MLDPPHCLHPLLLRLCSQMLDPPHSLHSLLMRLCSQMLDLPHCLQLLLLRLCSQMLDPPHSLHWLLWRLCGHFAGSPRHSLHMLLLRLCPQMLDPRHCLHLLSSAVVLADARPAALLALVSSAVVRALCGLPAAFLARNFCAVVVRALCGPLLHSASSCPRPAHSLGVPPHAAPSLPCRLPRTKDALSSPQPPLSPCLETLPGCVWSLSTSCL
jgi:hypothetical protein